MCLLMMPYLSMQTRRAEQVDRNKHLQARVTELKRGKARAELEIDRLSKRREEAVSKLMDATRELEELKSKKVMTQVLLITSISHIEGYKVRRRL